METIIKSKAHINYTIISNAVLQSDKLSARAKGLFCYLQSLPADWVINKSELHNHFKEGREAIIAAFKELEKAQLVFAADQVNKNGRWQSKTWLVYPDFPEKLPKTAQFTDPQKTVNGKPVNGNPSLQKKETKETYKTIVGYLNEKIKTRYKWQSSKTQSLISSRLKEGFIVEDFRAVIDKKVAEWQTTDMAKFLRPETLFGTKFESYLNQKSVNQRHQIQFH